MFRIQERNSGRNWELLPPTIRFVVWRSPLSLVQESINVLGNCAVQVSVPAVENHSDGYPGNIFRIWNTLSLVQSTFDMRMDTRLDDYNIQLTFRNLKPRIKAALY